MGEVLARAMEYHCAQTDEQVSEGVMVWGAIGPGYKSPLIRCSVEVGESEYLRVLEE
jgi:hypothetical protein